MTRTLLLMALALAALLGTALPAGVGAAEAPGAPVGLGFEEPAGEALEEECEEVEEGFEECEEADEGEASRAPEECPLRSASARAVVHAERRQLKLTIGYTTHEPANATIALRKGSLRLGSIRRHLGRSGVIRLTKALSAAQTSRFDTGDRIAVQLRIAGAPTSCKRVGSLSPRLVLRHVS